MIDDSTKLGLKPWDSCTFDERLERLRYKLREESKIKGQHLMGELGISVRQEKSPLSGSIRPLIDLLD